MKLSMMRRACWVVLMTCGLAWPLVSGMNQVQHEERLRVMLLQVQKAVQDYHVDQERYLPRRSLKGAELIGVLSDFGFLDEMPLNPWTKNAWKLDGEEADFLRYETDENFEHMLFGRSIRRLER